MNPRPHVLLAAPPQSDLHGLRDALEARGCQVHVGREPADLVRQVEELLPHVLVISEARLLDLLDLCRAVRAISRAPLLVLGQRDVEEDEVLCLEYGADDYLCPAASVRRVVAHVLALARRGFAQSDREGEAARIFGDVRIDRRRHRVYRGEQELELSHKEYALLTLLVDHAGTTVPRQRLTDAVWGKEVVASTRTLDVHIHWLREKLEDDVGSPRHIRTVRGVGYCFEP